jgi:hypothetical protein
MSQGVSRAEGSLGVSSLANGNGKAGAVEIPVEFVHDPESGGWAFRVPSLHITGGAQTEDQAKEMAREAILFALEDPDPTPGGATKRGYFQATVTAPEHLVPVG